MVDPNIIGKHTDRKLSVLESYLKFYATALQKQQFSLVYIDAFAGTGDRSAKMVDPDLISEAVETTDTKLKRGSAKIALDVEPQMNVYAFFEEDRKRFKKLEKLKQQYPNRNIVVKHCDANDGVKRLCKNLPWRGPETVGRGMRGVLFLDPFGMSVDWNTLKMVADTKAIDLWYLFPTQAILRQATKDPKKLSAEKIASLNRTLGGSWWRDELYSIYEPRQKDDLFSLSDVELDSDGPSKKEIRSATAGDVERTFKNKLEEIFPYVCENPLPLENHNVARYFSLFFAVANDEPKAIGLAKKASDHILKQAQIEGIRSKSDLYKSDR